MSVPSTPQTVQVRVAPGAPLRAPREMFLRDPSRRPEAARNLLNVFNGVSQAPGAPLKMGHAHAESTDIASVRSNLFGTENRAERMERMTSMTNAPRKAEKSGQAGKPDEDEQAFRTNLFPSK